MNDRAKKIKIALVITVFSVMIGIFGIIFSALTLNYSIAHGKPIGYASTSLWIMIVILCSNMVLLMINLSRYKIILSNLLLR